MNTGISTAHTLLHHRIAIVIVIFGLGATALMAGQSPASISDDTDRHETESDWMTTELTDIHTGDTFTIDSLDRPVLVETFAVWCTTCTQQQKEMQTLHEQTDNIVSVSLNIDPNEDVAAIQEHTERYGFDWRYAVAPSAMTQDLIDEFGRSITVAPQAPMILICPDGTTERLPDGVKPAETLRQHVQETCGQ